MEIEQIYIYLFVMSAVTIAIRLVPLTLIPGHLRHHFHRTCGTTAPSDPAAVRTAPPLCRAG